MSYHSIAYHNNNICTRANLRAPTFRPESLASHNSKAEFGGRAQTSKREGETLGKTTCRTLLL